MFNCIGILFKETHYVTYSVQIAYLRSSFYTFLEFLEFHMKYFVVHPIS